MRTLTRRVCEDYAKGSEENASHMSLLYDARNRKLYRVPKDQSHIEYAAEIMGIREDELNGNASHLIPVAIGFNVRGRLEIDGLIVGLSSLENERGVPHKKTDINRALEAVKEMIKKSEFQESPDYKEAVFYGFNKE